MAFLASEPDIFEKTPGFLCQEEVVYSMAAATKFAKTEIEKHYEIGKQLFIAGKPRPVLSDAESGFGKPEDAAYYGWMMERIERINFISRWLVRQFGAKTPEYEEQLSKSIASMDAEHGLTKDDFNDFIAHQPAAEDIR